MTNPMFVLTVYTHFFKLTYIRGQATPAILAFSKRFLQMGYIRLPNGRTGLGPIKMFAAADKARSEFRFHINALEEFIDFLTQRGIHFTDYERRIHDLYDPESINIRIKPDWVLRDYQVPVVEYLTKNYNTDRSRFVDLQTGRGKTLSATWAISDLGKRVVIMVRPLFIQKWCDDMVKITNINPKNVLVVQGNAHLKGLIDIANDPQFKYPVIIISNKTFQNYITKYELDPRSCVEEYGISPEDFYEHLRAGIRLVDEVHLDFHLNFKMDMYTNIPLTMALSATLLNDDEFIELMYKVMYPMQQRYLGGALDKYIDSYAIMYNHKSTMRISTMEYGSKTYSHHAFEKSIMKNAFYTKSYFKLIDYVIEAGFISDYKKGERLAVFVSSIHMATELTEHLKKQHPTLDVRRYVEKDPYENLLDADIRITTILSAGTGHDIANLKMVLLTVAVSSSQANIQTLGRLRKSDKMPTRFYYLIDLNIPKHMQYHERKKKMLQHRAMSFKEFFYPDLLGG